MPWVPFGWVTPRGSGRANPRRMIARTWREFNELVMGGGGNWEAVTELKSPVRTAVIGGRPLTEWGELWGVPAIFRSQSPKPPHLNLQLPEALTKFYPAFPITSIWLENHSSRQLWRELAPESAFSRNIPTPRPPREFQNPCENTGISKPTQG